MQINRISSLNFFTAQNSTKQTNSKNTKNSASSIKPTTNPLDYHFNDYLLSFEARVDKGLPRFYEENKDRMPHTVKTYIDTLPNKRGLSPLQAQYNAYKSIVYAKTTDEIKQAYPDEELFSELKSSSENKAKRGLLYEIKIMSDDLKKGGETVLPDDEDLSVYIVKKIFLEAKSLSEINEDLDKDLNPIFKKEDKNYINYSTLETLGIKLPNQEYLTSLRFTRDGYSDEIGSKISEAQQKYYDSLTPEERAQRAKKSLSNIENWWNSLSDSDKKELLLSQNQELELLKKFQNRKKTLTGEHPTQKKESASQQTIHQHPHQSKEKIRTSLSDDPLFLEWAEKNLKLYYENLSDEEKQQISEKRSQTMIARWNSMDEAQKADYIEKMQTGSEKQRFAMINAWNNCNDIRNHMSEFMRERNIHNIGNFIYRSKEYTEAQRNLMISFWSTYPEDAKKLGEEIKNSWAEINKAVENNSFEELKESIVVTQTRIKKDLKKHRQSVEMNPSLNNFAKIYRGAYSYLPEEYLQAYFNLASKTLDEKDLRIWGKILKDEAPTETERTKLAAKMKSIDDSVIFTEKRAMEQSLAEILYDATDEPEMFSLSFNDLNLIAATSENMDFSKRKSWSFTLTSEDQSKKIVTLRRKPDFSKIDRLYRKYNKKLSDRDIDSIIKANFIIAEEDMKKMEQPLREFLANYGQAAMFIFGQNGTEETKTAAYKKFQNLMPEELKQDGVHSEVLDNSFENVVYNKYSREYYFIPEEFRKFYISQMTENKTSSECKALLKSLNAPKDKAIPPEEPRKFSTEFIRKRLAMEQALAESVYEQTDNPLAFALTYEQLAYFAKTLLQIPPSQFPQMFSLKYDEYDKNETIMLVKAPIDTSDLTSKYNKYKKELSPKGKSFLEEKTQNYLADTSIVDNYGSTLGYITKPQIMKIVCNKMAIYHGTRKQ